MNYNTIISERQDRGEVITPKSLVEEMIDKLPKEVFESETTTFLDPCFGTGSFLMAIGIRLKKYGHSTENINSRLFGFEVDSRMFNETKRKFRGISIIKEDFLNADINMKFDVIIGNPPFQGSQMGGGKGSGNAIWQKFVEKAYENLKDNGYMSLIHPTDWRTSLNKKKIAKASNILFENQIDYLELSAEPFKGQAVAIVDWYVLRKQPKALKTLVKSKDGLSKINIESNKMLFSYNSKMFNSITKSVFNTEHNGFMNRMSFGGLTKLDQNMPTGEYTFAHGGKFFSEGKIKTFNYPHVDQFKKKVIMSAVGKFRPMYDESTGIGDHVHYILVNSKKQADFLISIINSRLGMFLQKTHCTSDWKGDYAFSNVWYPFSRILLDDVNLKSDKDVYSYFNLTEEQIKYIESEVEPVK